MTEKTQNTEVEQQVQPDPNAITVHDLGAVVKALDVAMINGGFRTWADSIQAYQVREKLAIFLNSHAEQAVAQAEQAETSEE